MGYLANDFMSYPGYIKSGPVENKLFAFSDQRRIAGYLSPSLNSNKSKSEKKFVRNGVCGPIICNCRRCWRHWFRIEQTIAERRRRCETCNFLENILNFS